MKREDIMTTYKNLIQTHKSFEKPIITVQPEIVEYVKKYGKREAYLYNNRIFFGYINPSDTRKAEYNANWEYINSLAI